MSWWIPESVLRSGKGKYDEIDDDDDNDDGDGDDGCHGGSHINTNNNNNNNNDNNNNNNNNSDIIFQYSVLMVSKAVDIVTVTMNITVLCVSSVKIGLDMVPDVIKVSRYIFLLC